MSIELGQQEPCYPAAVTLALLNLQEMMGNIRKHPRLFILDTLKKLREGKMNTDLQIRVGSVISFKQEFLKHTALNSCQNSTGTTLQRKTHVTSSKNDPKKLSVPPTSL